MTNQVQRSIAAVGDVSDPSAWSGIPYFFWQAASAAGFASSPLQFNLDWIAWPRRRWAARRIFRRQKPAGYQYSLEFLDAAEALIPPDQLAGEIISFNQHFPRAATVRAAGGSISYYIDATFAAMSSGRGLDLRLPADVIEVANKLERRNYELADRVITMATWTAQSVIADCGINAEKVHVVLPGSNLNLPPGWTAKKCVGRAGQDRPFVLGFVGKDWQRKGLPLICDVRDRLTERGWQVVVRAAGSAPPSLATREGVEFVGYLDKSSGSDEFVDFLAGCDIGCLFSTHEALGISTLEFLRVGVPVAGYAVEGLADTLPTDAGMRFSPGSSAAEITDRIDIYLRNEDEQQSMARAARAYSPYLTWDRCVDELQRIWAAEKFEPFRLAENEETKILN